MTFSQNNRVTFITNRDVSRIVTRDIEYFAKKTKKN